MRRGPCERGGRSEMGLLTVAALLVCAGAGAGAGVQLSDSYLPVAMQLLAHYVDQLAFETQDPPAGPPASPPASPPAGAPDYAASYGNAQPGAGASTALGGRGRLGGGGGVAAGELESSPLQLLGGEARDVLLLAHDAHDERALDIPELHALAAAGAPLPAAGPPRKLSHSHLRLLLLYDLLSRDAKKQKLADYSGFSGKVLQELGAGGAGAGSGGARQQLARALRTMLERGDCKHDYANNRAKEIVSELSRDDSLLSAELRYLHPLSYTL